MAESFLNYISTSYVDTTLTDKWANGQFGEIVDIKGDGNYRFVDYGMDADGKPYKLYLTEKDEMACPVVATGFVAYWLHNRNKRVKEIFEGYFTQQLQAYERAHEYDDDAWERDLKREFVEREHLSTEQEAIRTSEAIFPYLTENDVNRIQSITDNYLRFARKKHKELYPPNYPKGKELQETFLAPFRMGGAAVQCVDWMRWEYNLPRTKPTKGKPARKERLDDSWKEWHEVEHRQWIKGEYESYLDTIPIDNNHSLMEEINENLKSCVSHDNRFRYITSLVQPFHEFAVAFDATSMINSCERKIKQLEQDRKRWEEVADNAVDRSGEPLDKQEQIEACDKWIQERKERIEYLNEVQNRFYYLAQHGVTGKCVEGEDPEMSEMLGAWWEQMIRFARHLAALALTYGIKLADVQEQCGIYLMRYFFISDYVDHYYIVNVEHAKRLLHEIASNQAKTAKENSVKPNTEAEPDQRITTEEATPQPEQSQTRKTQAKSSKQSKKEGKQANKPLVYYTLKYINQNPTRYTRIDCVHRKLAEWGWMAETTSIESYEQLFSGTHADCQLKWAGDAPTLYKLMQELLKQPFIERYKGCSARSIVLSQFSDKFNQHTERVSNDDLQKIKYIIYLLNPKSNIPMTGRRGNETPDLSDEALAEAMVYSGELSNSSHA